MSAHPASRRTRPVLVKRGSVTVKIYRGTTRGYESFTLSYYEGSRRVRRTFPSLARARTEAEIAKAVGASYPEFRRNPTMAVAVF